MPKISMLPSGTWTRFNCVKCGNSCTTTNPNARLCTSCARTVGREVAELKQELATEALGQIHYGIGLELVGRYTELALDRINRYIKKENIRESGLPRSYESAQKSINANVRVLTGSREDLRSRLP